MYPCWTLGDFHLAGGGEDTVGDKLRGIPCPGFGEGETNTRVVWGTDGRILRRQSSGAFCVEVFEGYK